MCTLCSINLFCLLCFLRHLGSWTQPQVSQHSWMRNLKTRLQSLRISRWRRPAAAHGMLLQASMLQLFVRLWHWYFLKRSISDYGVKIDREEGVFPWLPRNQAPSVRHKLVRARKLTGDFSIPCLHIFVAKTLPSTIITTEAQSVQCSVCFSLVWKRNKKLRTAWNWNLVPRIIETLRMYVALATDKKRIHEYVLPVPRCAGDHGQRSFEKLYPFIFSRKSGFLRHEQAIRFGIISMADQHSRIFQRHNLGSASCTNFEISMSLFSIPSHQCSTS